MEAQQPRFQEPGWFTRNLVDPLAAGLTKLGISLAGMRGLEVRGRNSGEWRRTSVNPLDLDGERYLVAPRGNSHWVRNLRASGEGRLVLGRRREVFRATELADAEKAHVLRAYLEKWAWEVGAFFSGVGPKSTDEELLAIAPDHPVFRISR